MRKTRLITSFLLAGGLALSTSGFAHTATSTPMDITPGIEILTGNSIFDNLKESEDYSMFLEKLETTGLADQLKGEAPYTVLAPTNAVMNTISQEILNNNEDLKALLSEHILRGSWTLEDLQGELGQTGGKMTIKTINGHYSKLYLDGNDVILLTPDAQKVNLQNATTESNGVIYKVNTMITPIK